MSHPRAPFALTTCLVSARKEAKIQSEKANHANTHGVRLVRPVSGSVVGYGNVNPGVKVEVFDKPEVWADDSLSLNEKRKRQNLIATASTDSKGKFDFRGVRKGSYEVQFSTGNGGWNILSVLVNVDPAGSHDRFCVQLSLEGAGPKPSVEACH